jgi:hypothetical protein
MLLDIKPLHFDGCNCFEDFVFSLTAYLNREYQLAFSEGFGFQFNPEDPLLPGIVGNRINSANNNMALLLEKFCGINIKINRTNTTEEAMKLINGQLDINMPSGIYLNTFYCPWHREYKSISHEHYCMVVGMDSDKNYFCIDPPLSSNVCLLP